MRVYDFEGIPECFCSKQPEMKAMNITKDIVGIHEDQPCANCGWPLYKGDEAWFDDDLGYAYCTDICAKDHKDL